MSKFYLHILQLEGYNILRFLRWLYSNPLKRSVEGKKSLVWTTKASLLYYLSILLIVVVPVCLSYFSALIGLLAIVVLLVFPWITLIFALVLIKPYEIVNRQLVIKRTRDKILSIQGLRVIGITGSYGKTTVKEMLYQLLRMKYRVLRTPSSYNTVFGIAKVVDLELDSNYEIFICEMGAYKRGEIAELCRMVNPQHGILTGIAEQHLERFGSLQNIIRSKFELIEYLPSGGIAVLNGDNSHVVENAWKSKTIYKYYGVDNKKADVRAENIKYTNSGTEFDLKIKNIEVRVKTKLLGKGNVQNILAAVTLASELGVSHELLVSGIEKLIPTPNRLEIVENNKNIMINDSYSSNPAGFKEAISVASQFKAKNKIIITPGIVELGSKTREIHEELGKEINKVFDRVILVGNSERTIALAKNIDKTKIEFVETAKVALEKINLVKESLILIENDLPDNY